MSQIWPELRGTAGSPAYAGSWPPVVSPSVQASGEPASGAMAARPLLSAAARKAAIDLASSLRSFEVTRALTAAGLRLPLPEPLPEGLTRTQKFLYVLAAMASSGSTNTVVTACFAALDWSRSDHVLRALDAVGELLWLYELRLEEGAEGFYGTAEKALRLRRLLKKEGYEVDEDAIIHPSPDVLAVGSLKGLRDPGAIRAVLKRINKALPDDPALAIGSAKELIEATAKTVVAIRGQVANPKADLPQLVYQAEVALCVHPQSVADGVDGAPEVRKVLGLLTSLTDKVAELRNRYGTGHGVIALPDGLRPRHGRLAVATANAWCIFMLDTLADPDASWRRSPTS